jgi:glutathione S-transferase
LFTLYSTPLSANGRKVLAVCHQLDLRPEIRLVNVYQGEGRTPGYLAVNPTGKIPTLVDGEFTLSESNAILQYISEAYGDFRLFSRDPKERAGIASWLFWESAHWQPALISVLAPFVGHKLRPEISPAPSDAPDWGDGQLRPLLARLDAQLRGHTFLAGNTLAIADFSVGGMMTYFRAAEFPFADFPDLAAWYERLEALDAWQRTAADPWK